MNPSLGDNPVRDWLRASAQAGKLSGEERRNANQALRRERNALVQAFQASFIQRRFHEARVPDESLVWFWFNHFNVHAGKGLVGAALPGYVDEAIRPRVQGHFKDLLLAALTHPAMLAYLDNTANTTARLNENLARELLELHTLGVDGGYTQADVQAVARVLTGLGLAPLEPVDWPPRWRLLAVQRGDFLFDPRRHDFEPKEVLGHMLPGEGFAEVQALVRLLAAHPATARHVTRKLGLFLLGDAAPAQVTERAAAEFRRTDGDLRAVTQALLQPAAGQPPRAPTFKDPMRWVLSAMELLRAGQPLRNPRPLLRWLQALGQPLFGCSTPDGYSLRGADWISAGQLAQRFELAHEIVSTLPRVVDNARLPAEVLATATVQQVLRTLDPPARAVLERAPDPAARLALLLCSPAFMYW